MQCDSPVRVPRMASEVALHTALSSGVIYCFAAEALFNCGIRQNMEIIRIKTWNKNLNECFSDMT